MDAATERKHIQAIEEIRRLQKRFFDNPSPPNLQAMRAAEEAMDRVFPDARSVKSHSPDGFQIFHLWVSLRLHHRAWMKARATARDAPPETAPRLWDEAVRLEGTCKKKERDLDRALQDYATPGLPGIL